MPPIKKRAKKEESESGSGSDSDSGPEDRGPAKKPSSSGGNPNRVQLEGSDEPTWELDKNRYAKVRNFKGKVYVDVREYYEKDGKTLPGKKGISLSVSQWKKFLECKDDIDKEVNKG